MNSFVESLVKFHPSACNAGGFRAFFASAKNESPCDAFIKFNRRIFGNTFRERLREFFIFVSKVSIRQGWNPPTREEITDKLEELEGAETMRMIKSFYELGWLDGRTSALKEREQRGDQKCLRRMLKKCISLRFPQTSPAMINSILAITDVDVLESIFTVACTADSLDVFQQNVRGIASIS